MKKRNTRADKLHFERLVEMGCIVCKIHLGVYTHPEIHHLRSGCGAGQRSDNNHTIPLCHTHHRTGGHGVAVHAGKQTWEKNFGTEMELLEQVNNELGISYEA